ncbi:hypothetical protein DPQ22_00350 [Candidatus Tokpelaia sp.]|nr:hypothetical protein DPQ22_00350 [Candidatus Tokpelaia sp.]
MSIKAGRGGAGPVPPAANNNLSMLPALAGQRSAPWLWGVFFIPRLFHWRSTGYNKARLPRQKQGSGLN